MKYPHRDSLTLGLDYDASNNLIYLGKAKPGTATSDSTWQIVKLTYDASNNLTNIQWSGGNSGFVSVWDNRVAGSYS